MSASGQVEPSAAPASSPDTLGPNWPNLVPRAAQVLCAQLFPHTAELLLGVFLHKPCKVDKPITMPAKAAAQDPGQQLPLHTNSITAQLPEQAVSLLKLHPGTVWMRLRENRCQELRAQNPNYLISGVYYPGLKTESMRHLQHFWPKHS